MNNGGLRHYKAVLLSGSGLSSYEPGLPLVILGAHFYTCLFDVLEVAFACTVKLEVRTGTGSGSANAGSCGVFDAALTSNSAKTAVFSAGNSILLPGSVGGQHPPSPAERCAGTGLFRLSEMQCYSTTPALSHSTSSRALFPTLRLY